MDHSADVIVVGAGLTGAALSLALARAGLSVAVIDAAPASAQSAGDFDGRSYALAQAGVKMLQAIGVWSDVAAAQPIHDVRVSDGRAGEGAMLFGLHIDEGELDAGPMGHMVEDRHLRPALQAALQATSGVDYHSGSAVTGQTVTAGRAEVVLSTGRTLTAPLLIGADGRSGATAGRAGISRRTHDYTQAAMVCAVAHARPHHGTAHQFFMPEGPLAILPLTGDRSSIVWTAPKARAAQIQALAPDDYLTVLRPRFGDFLGEIGLDGVRYSYPLALSLADRTIAARVALVGDAARSIHPIAGQGLNSGLRDVAALAEVIVQARRRGEDIGADGVLARYARWRRFDSTTLAMATDGFNRLFSSDNPLLRLGRGLGMGAVNATGPLRRAFLREAAGLSGDVPRLLRGQQI